MRSERAWILSVVLTVLLIVGVRGSAVAEEEQQPRDSSLLEWLWVVPALPSSEAGDLVLSGFFARLGRLELKLALVDRRGDMVATASWELNGGEPADFSLSAMKSAPEGRMSLLLSGLDAGPKSLALALFKTAPGQAPVEIRGLWIQSDANWLPATKIRP